MIRSEIGVLVSVEENRRNILHHVPNSPATRDRVFPRHYRATSAPWSGFVVNSLATTKTGPLRTSLERGSEEVAGKERPHVHRKRTVPQTVSGREFLELQRSEWYALGLTVLLKRFFFSEGSTSLLVGKRSAGTVSIERLLDYC